MTKRRLKFVLAGLLAAIAQAPAFAAELEIVLDRAQVFNIPIESRTLIIGNPTIADVSIIQPGLMVITGKAFGLTNLVSLDQDGKQIANSMIRVSAADEQMLTVIRGGANETLHCPDGKVCSNTITLGDSNDSFSKLTGQIPARQGLAASSTPGQSK
jgi:Flp pilus assembly secretin CpaC